MVRQDSKRSCWTSPKRHHNRWSLMAVVANQAVAFDKSMLGGLSPSRTCALSESLPIDEQTGRNRITSFLPTIWPRTSSSNSDQFFQSSQVTITCQQCAGRMLDCRDIGV